MGFNKTVNEQGKERAMKALQQFLRPEFINRVDEIVYFNKLTEENFRPIARLIESYQSPVTRLTARSDGEAVELLAM